MIVKSLVLITCVVLPQSLQAQLVTSPLLDTLIQQTLVHNPQLNAFRSEVAGAQARITTAKAWPDPQLRVEFMRTPVSSGNIFTDASERLLALEQMIPFPGKTSRAASVEEANVRVRTHMTAEMERRMIASVKKQYGMLFSAQRRLDVVKENEEWLQHMIRSAETRLAVGLSAQADVLRLQTENAKLRSERAMIESDIHIAEGMLNEMRAMPATSEIQRIPDYPLETFVLPLEDITMKAGQTRPELNVMRAEVDMRNAEVDMWKKERLPDFMLGAGYMFMNEMGNTWQVMAGINIPIAPWSSGKYSGRIEENEALQHAAEQHYEDTRNRIAFEVYEAWSKAKARWESAHRYETEIIPMAEQTLQSLFAEYQTRRTDFLSVLDAFRMLSMHKMNYYMELGEYITNLADIEYSVGITLDELKKLK